jgi:hypothetical protein
MKFLFDYKEPQVKKWKQFSVQNKKMLSEVGKGIKKMYVVILYYKTKIKARNYTWKTNRHCRRTNLGKQKYQYWD